MTDHPEELDGPPEERNTSGSGGGARESGEPQSRAGDQPKSHRKIGPSFAASDAQSQDLSDEIASTVAKSAGERVTCRRVSGNYYRCNWWAAQRDNTKDGPGAACLLVTTHRVCKSEMLLVTKTESGLKMEPANRSRS